MDCIVVTICALACFIYLRWSRRRRDRLAEVAATGMLRSPLYLAKAVLLLLLLGLMISAGHLQHDSPVMTWAWLAALGLVLVAQFFVHRALKWRYPI
jgi:hypothetical protein